MKYIISILNRIFSDDYIRKEIQIKKGLSKIDEVQTILFIT